jgi:hypothetical protein
MPLECNFCAHRIDEMEKSGTRFFEGLKRSAHLDGAAPILPQLRHTRFRPTGATPSTISRGG